MLVYTWEKYLSLYTKYPLEGWLQVWFYCCWEVSRLGSTKQSSHLPLFSPSYLRWTDFLLQYIKPSCSLTLHCTLACYVKHCFDCLGSLEIHTRSRWTEQLVLHCRPGSLSMIWLGIMSPQGKRALHARCPLTVLLASQNESPFNNPQRKYSSKTSQADKQRKRKAYVLGSHGNF